MKNSFENLKRSKLLEEVNKEIIKKKNNPNECLINSKSLKEFINEYDILIVTINNMNYRSSQKSIKGIKSLIPEKKLTNKYDTKNRFSKSKNFDNSVFSNSFFEFKGLKKIKVSDNKLLNISKNSRGKSNSKKTTERFKVIRELFVSSKKKQKNCKREMATNGFNYLNKLVEKLKKKEEVSLLTPNSLYSPLTPLENSFFQNSKIIKNKFSFYDQNNKSNIRNMSSQSSQEFSPNDCIAKSSITSSNTITPMSMIITEEENENDPDKNYNENLSFRANSSNINFSSYFNKYQVGNNKNIKFNNDSSSLFG